MAIARSGETLRQVLIQSGLVTAEQVDEIAGGSEGTKLGQCRGR